MDDFVNGFVPEEIFAQDLQDQLDLQNSASKREERAASDAVQSTKIDKEHEDNKSDRSTTGTNNVQSDHELQSEIDLLGTLDFDQLDNVLSIADNMAIKLAYETSLKMKNLKSKVKSQIAGERAKIMKKFL